MWLKNLFKKKSTSGANNEVFVFAIPLIGSHLTRDFESICRLLGKTLQSCLRQTDKNFRILVACNEVPKAGTVPQDARIEYLILKRVSKSELIAWPRHDVSLKRHALMKAAVDMRAKYYFQLDADDLVSNKLVEQVRRVGDNNGCVVGLGYLLDSRTDHLYLLPTPKLPKPAFDGLCGSSIIVSLRTDAGDDVKEKNLDFLLKVWRLGHDSARHLFDVEGRPAHVLDFPAVIYRLNHGGNLYMRLNPEERMSFIDEVVAICAPVSEVALRLIREEFFFF